MGENETRISDKIDEVSMFSTWLSSWCLKDNPSRSSDDEEEEVEEEEEEDKEEKEEEEEKEKEDLLVLYFGFLPLFLIKQKK